MMSFQKKQLKDTAINLNFKSLLLLLIRRLTKNIFVSVHTKLFFSNRNRAKNYKQTLTLDIFKTLFI